jgi:hypothetical protein
LGVGLDVFGKLDCGDVSVYHHGELVSHILVSPASPENAIRVCLFNCLVLSSDALRMVAPLIAALEVAMMVKSFPVMPSKTSLIAKEGPG